MDRATMEWVLKVISDRHEQWNKRFLALFQGHADPVQVHEAHDRRAECQAIIGILVEQEINRLHAEAVALDKG